MKLSIFSLAFLMGMTLSAALPNAEAGKDDKKKGPPGPPDSAYGSVSQSCSASQSSIHCCQANGGQGKDHKVKYQDQQYNMVCSQINGESSRHGLSPVTYLMIEHRRLQQECAEYLLDHRCLLHR